MSAGSMNVSVVRVREPGSWTTPHHGIPVWWLVKNVAWCGRRACGVSAQRGVFQR
jgi:hypothetical protein